MEGQFYYESDDELKKKQRAEPKLKQRKLKEREEAKLRENAAKAGNRNWRKNSSVPSGEEIATKFISGSRPAPGRDSKVVGDVISVISPVEFYVRTATLQKEMHKMEKKLVAKYSGQVAPLSPENLRINRAFVYRKKCGDSGSKFLRAKVVAPSDCTDEQLADKTYTEKEFLVRFVDLGTYVVFNRENSTLMGRIFPLFVSVSAPPICFRCAIASVSRDTFSAQEGAIFRAIICETHKSQCMVQFVYQTRLFERIPTWRIRLHDLRAPVDVIREFVAECLRAKSSSANQNWSSTLIGCGQGTYDPSRASDFDSASVTRTNASSRVGLNEDSFLFPPDIEGPTIAYKASMPNTADIDAIFSAPGGFNDGDSFDECENLSCRNPAEPSETGALLSARPEGAEKVASWLLRGVEPTPIDRMSDDDDQDMDQTQVEKDEWGFERYPKSGQPPLRDRPLMVQITHANTPLDFYVQTLQMEHMAHLVASRMQAQFSDPAPNQPQPFPQTRFQSLEQLAKGAPVAALYVDSDGGRGWYRGSVRDIDPTTALVCVQFVDYGNTENLPLSHLRPLTDVTYRFTPLAHRCRLKGIRGEQSEALTPQFLDYLRHWTDPHTHMCRFMCQYVSGKSPFWVRLFNPADNCDVVETLSASLPIRLKTSTSVSVAAYSDFILPSQY